MHGDVRPPGPPAAGRLSLRGPLRGRPAALLALGTALAVAAALASTALLGLAGWFIGASAVAGLSTVNFSFFYPSAGVQALALLRTSARYAERVHTHSATLRALARLRTRLFRAAAHLPLSELGRLRSGDLLTRVLADVDALDQVILRVFVPTIVAAIACASGLAVLTAIAPSITLIVALGLLLELTLAAVGLAAGRSAATELVSLRAHNRTRLVEALDGLPELLSYGAQEMTRSDLVEDFAEADRLRRAAAARDALAQAAADILASATLAAVLAVGLSADRHLPAPTLALAAMLALGLFELVAPLPGAYRSWTEARAAQRRLEDLVSAPTGSGPGRPFPIGRPFRLQNVSAGYGPATALTVESLTVPPGGLTVLRGASGAGKSTLLRLLAGALEPRQGNILIGATSLTDIHPEELTRHITLVDQDSHIFDGTIDENLRMGHPAATTEQLADVLAVVALDALVNDAQQATAMPVGAHGHSLSGGQRRRLSIAQALLRRPEVLLLDEPTEGLDNDTARQVLAAIRNHLPEATIIVALHERALDHLPAGHAYQEITVGGHDRAGHTGIILEDKHSSDWHGVVMPKALMRNKAVTLSPLRQWPDERPSTGYSSAVVLTIALAVFGGFVTYLPLTAVSVSLTTIGTATGAATSDLQWVSDAYIIPMAAMILSAGVFGDLHGRRRVYVLGMGLTAVGAAVAGLGSNVHGVAALHMLWVGQAVLGTGAGLLLPTTLALIAHAVPDLRARGRFVAMWATGLVLGLAAAPLIAGGILKFAGWGWIFAPMGAAALITGAIAFVRMPESKAPQGRHLDWPGQITATIVIVASIYGVIEAGDSGWGSAAAVVGLGLAAAALIAFVALERGSSSPIVDMSLFRSPTFSAAGLAALGALFALVGSIFLLSLYFGGVQHLSPWDIGVRLLFLNLTSAVFNPLVGRLLAHRSALLLLAIGLATGSLAMFLIKGLEPHSSLMDTGWRLAVLGLANAFMLSTVAVASIHAVPHHLAGMAAATNTVLRQFGGALGPAVLGVIVNSRMSGGADMTSAMGTAFTVNGALLLAIAIAVLLTACRTHTSR